MVAIIIAGTFPMDCFSQSSSDANQSKEKLFHIGYGFGFNTMGLSIAANPDFSVKAKAYLGLNFHLAANFNFSQRLGLTIYTGILFNQRNINISNSVTKEEITYPVESAIIEFPVALKYKLLPKKNRTSYFLIGFSPNLDALGTELPKETVKRKAPVTLLRSFDLHPEIGLGVDYQLRKVKFGIELKFSLGLFDVNLKPDDPMHAFYASAINTLYSRLIIFNFNFE
jgi:hypothetical protein